MTLAGAWKRYRGTVMAVPVSLVVALATLEVRLDGVESRVEHVEQAQPAVQSAMVREVGRRMDRMDARLGRIEGLLLDERRR